jgi:predicted acetyltransferase
MMRKQLTGLHESGGEPIAMLNASEATIYGRFGYGIASGAGRHSHRVRDLPISQRGGRYGAGEGISGGDRTGICCVVALPH